MKCMMGVEREFKSRFEPEERYPRDEKIKLFNV